MTRTENIRGLPRLLERPFSDPPPWPAEPADTAQIAAEDIHVATCCRWATSAGTHFEQPAWGKAARYGADGHALVSGQEDPRTGQLGHAIHRNLERPIHLDRDT